MPIPARPRSPLWLVVLSLACEEPMHPYRMQTLIKQRGKDQIANVAQRNSVYQTIDALERAGLIRVRETSRAEHRPERTVYEATAEGRHALATWLRTVLAVPAREFPDFPAALSLLDPTVVPELADLLEQRAVALGARLAEAEKSVPGLPRLFLLEEEYMAAVLRAEIQWLRATSSELRTGKIAFPTIEELRSIGPGAPSEQAFERFAKKKPRARRKSRLR